MRIATYNAASIRARLPLILEWLAVNEPDVLAIQETKVEDPKFPREEIEALGYMCAIHGQKSWNGVALLSRLPMQNVRFGFEDDLMETDCRVISANIDGIEVVNTYVPNGNSVGSEKWVYKFRWLARFDRLLRERYSATTPLVWLGDVNIAPKPEDVYDSKKLLGSVGHHPDEFQALERIVAFGLVDLFRKFEPGGGHFTYWDFVIPKSVDRNLGWRIDHIYATEGLAATCTGCGIDVAARRMERPSDHTYVFAELG
jgi:exodeoxyribonuclease-3